MAGLVEASRREGVGVLLVEGVSPSASSSSLSSSPDQGIEGLLAERVPVLRRAGGGSLESGWAGKTVDVGRVLGRWFRVREGGWEGFGGG